MSLARGRFEHGERECSRPSQVEYENAIHFSMGPGTHHLTGAADCQLDRVNC